MVWQFFRGETAKKLSTVSDDKVARFYVKKECVLQYTELMQTQHKVREQMQERHHQERANLAQIIQNQDSN